MITAMKTTAPRFQVDPLCSRPVLPLDSLEYDPEVNLVKAAVSETLSKKVAVPRTTGVYDSGGLVVLRQSANPSRLRMSPTGG
jgi:hypothetical protein